MGLTGAKLQLGPQSASLTNLRFVSKGPDVRLSGQPGVLMSGRRIKASTLYPLRTPPKVLLGKQY